MRRWSRIARVSRCDLDLLFVSCAERPACLEWEIEHAMQMAAVGCVFPSHVLTSRQVFGAALAVLLVSPACSKAGCQRSGGPVDHGWKHAYEMQAVRVLRS